MRPGPSHRPQTKLRKGNVLHLSVILFTGGGGVSQHALGQTLLPRGRNPPGQTPPCTVHAGIHTPLPSACWDTQPPCPVHAGIHNPPAQCMQGYTTTPPAQCMLRYTSPFSPPPPPRRWSLLRTVRILRECILVLPNFRNVILEGAICCDNFIYIIFRFLNSLIKVSPPEYSSNH